MAIKDGRTALDELIQRLDEAVQIQETSGCCHAVKDVLHDIVASGEDFIPAEFMQPAPDKYARRLVHSDPKGKYTLLAMVWGKGQGTALHDHAGMWCVECVYRGRIKVVSYSLNSQDGDLYQFSPEKEVYASVSDAGALIPPFDYHTIENAEETPSVTLHVYGGEMNWCHAFVPTENGYRQERRELCYTP
jgi:predicted metal-dependent enzyme (double-stranded beta helix superfamily)